MSTAPHPTPSAVARGVSRAAVAEPRVIFVLGTERTGSTLLARLFDGIPGVASLGEASGTWGSLARSATCSCGEPSHVCPVWRRVHAAVTGDEGGEPLSDLVRRAGTQRSLHLLLRTSRRRAADPESHALVEQWRSLYVEFARVRGATVVVDTSKSPAALVTALATELPVTVLHMTRDPRAVLYSLTRRSRGRTRQSVLSLAANWCFTHGLAETHPAIPPHLHLRYEDLMGAPATSLSALAEDLGLSADWTYEPTADGVELHPRDAKVSHVLAGNIAVRQRQGTLRLEDDTEWRGAMPRRTQWAIATLTAPVAWRFGYVGRRRG